MSNCIDIEQCCKVRFEPWEINAEGLRDLIKRAETEVDKNNCVSEGTEPELKIAWWFLSNVKFVRTGAVEIWFGEGRSSHTWRDLKATVRILSQFVKVPRTHRFKASDESDGHETWFWLTVDLYNGTV